MINSNIYFPYKHWNDQMKCINQKGVFGHIQTPEIQISPPTSTVRGFAEHQYIQQLLKVLYVGSEGPDVQVNLGLCCPHMIKRHIFA